MTALDKVIEEYERRIAPDSIFTGEAQETFALILDALKFKRDHKCPSAITGVPAWSDEIRCPWCGSLEHRPIHKDMVYCKACSRVFEIDMTEAFFYRTYKVGRLKVDL